MAKLTSVTLIRHGEATSSERRIVGGHRGCSGLSPTGVRRAQEVGSRLAQQRLRPSLLLVSSLRRSRQTGRIVAEQLGVPVASPSCLWCERHAGSFDGVAFGSLPRSFRVEDPQRPMASGSESDDQVDARAAAGLRLVERDYAGMRLAIVTHLGFLLALVESATGNRLGLFSDQEFDEGTSVTLTRSLKGTWRCRL